MQIQRRFSMLCKSLRLGEEDDLVREKDRRRQQGRQRRTGNHLRCELSQFCHETHMWESFAGSFLVQRRKKDLAPYGWGKLRTHATWVK